MTTGLRVRFFPRAVLLAITVLVGTSEFASAGWVTIKNGTQQTIVVQETSAVKGQPRRGKPQILLPGESIRTFIPGPTVKMIEVHDARNAKTALWTGSLNCTDETQVFLVQSVGVKVSVVAQARPNDR